MNSEIVNLVAELQHEKFSDYEVKFWIIHRRLRRRIASYSAKFVSIENLNNDFVDILQKFIVECNDISDYKPLTVDMDDNSTLYARPEESDFEEIVNKINQGSDNPIVEELEELNYAWGYALEFRFEEKRIISFSKIQSGWNIKSKFGIKNIVFHEGKFENVTEGNIFPIRKTFDFICFENIVLIKDKKNYEMALNIREGLVIRREAIIAEMNSLKILSDITSFKSLIGDNKHYLRKLAMAQDYGYYNDKTFLNNLEKVSIKNGWEIKRVDGKFEINQDNLELFLTLLNNGRLKSIINDEIFDADVKTPVT